MTLIKKKSQLRADQTKDRRFKITKAGNGTWPMIKGRYNNVPLMKNTSSTEPITKQTALNNDILIKR